MARSLRAILFGEKGMRRGKAALDWWTLPHVASGVVLALLLADVWAIFLLVVVYEVFEALLRRIKTKEGAGVFEYESWPNIIADIIVAMVPWLIIAGFFPWYEAPIRIL